MRTEHPNYRLTSKVVVHMHRRNVLKLLSATIAWPCVAAAQDPKKRPVVGMLGQGTPAQLKGSQLRQFFLDGMREFGYVEGRDFDIVGRLAESTSDLPRAASGSA
jgi:putative tryptophan/tyrosine transport system substrate-binding protein